MQSVRGASVLRPTLFWRGESLTGAWRVRATVETWWWGEGRSRRQMRHRWSLGWRWMICELDIRTGLWIWHHSVFHFVRIILFLTRMLECLAAWDNKQLIPHRVSINWGIYKNHSKAMDVNWIYWAKLNKCGPIFSNDFKSFGVFLR